VFNNQKFLLGLNLKPSAILNGKRCKKGYSDIAKLLIEKHGADINVKNGAILKYYVMQNHSEMVEWLIDHGADIYADNNYVLRISSKKGYLNILKCLVKNGVNIGADNCAAIRIAVAHRHKVVAEYLIECAKKEECRYVIHI
jgi:ankyrin repeat protein